MRDKGSMVIVGAGAIGRGLAGDIAATNGMGIVFVEAFPEMVKKLRSAGGYNVNLVGRRNEIHPVDGYRALEPGDIEAVAAAIAECDFVVTAVGGANLPTLAAVIKAGLDRRTKHTNILLCENWPEADAVLKDALLGAGADRRMFSCVPCSVERMSRGNPDSVDITAESCQTLYVDATKWSGPKPELTGLNFCDNLDFYYKRKLYTNNAGHVLLAYLGYLAGYRYLHEATSNPTIHVCLKELLDIAGQTLVRNYAADPSAMACHLDDLIRWRFPNRELADTVARVAREPLRKLGQNERLVGLLRAAGKLGLPTEPIARVIAAALHYRSPDDPQSLELQEMIAHDGPGNVLEQICGLGQTEQEYRECMEFYHHQSIEMSERMKAS